MATTHTPVLFFSNRGMVYSLKVYKLPLGTPQSKGQALVNLLPLEKGEKITTILMLPEDVQECQSREIVFATSRGNIRRNSMADFTSIKSNGKIAMKFEDEDEKLIGVSICDESDDIFLTTLMGKCIRFAVTEVRQFAGRSSTGVRGIRLAAKDEVISLSILKHSQATREEREAYLKMANKIRRQMGVDEFQQSPTRLLNLLQVGDHRRLPRRFRILFEHLAIPENLIEGCSKLMPNVT